MASRKKFRKNKNNKKNLISTSKSPQEGFRTEYQRNNQNSEELIKLGVSLKRNGEYLKAKQIYESAMKITPWDLGVYYALGKINYLLEEQDEALINYTVAAHLHLGLGSCLDQNMGEGFRQASTSSYPQHIINELRSIHPYADLLIADPNTPRHLGHALIDLSPDDEHSISITAEARAYRESISGSGMGFFIQMDAELEQGLYFPVGVAYLLQHLQWEQIGKCPAEKVTELYRELFKSSSSDKVYEMELQAVFDKLSDVIKLQTVSSKTPFADLIQEIYDVLSNSDNESFENLENYAKQSYQAIEHLLARPLHSTINSLLFNSMNQNIAFRASTVNRWKDTVGLLQTPVIDFLFQVGKIASRTERDTPILNCVLSILRCREIIDLRNGLTHSCYSWSGSENSYEIHIMDRKTLGTDKAVIRVLPVDICEAFHSLVCTCLSVIRRISLDILNDEEKEEEVFESSIINKHNLLFGMRLCVDCNRPTGNWCESCESDNVKGYPPFPNRPFCSNCEDTHGVCKFCRT